MKPLPVYIGYDGDAEPVAYHVCADSVIRNATGPVAIIPLALNTVSHFYTERHTDGSNAFIYSRFLVPFLNDFEGQEIFLDGDMLVRGDVYELLQQHKFWAGAAVSVVKHAEYETKQKVKYLGAKNSNYPRKNWSSVIVWSCDHPSHRVLTPSNVEQMTGAQLHRFTWLEDKAIGALPAKWNRLVIEQEVQPDDKLLHFTLGTPCFIDYSECPHAHEWRTAAHNAFKHKEPV
jgi:hypothetical protein